MILTSDTSKFLIRFRVGKDPALLAAFVGIQHNGLVSGEEVLIEPFAEGPGFGIVHIPKRRHEPEQPSLKQSAGKTASLGKM
jgi:hypothetical protein